MTTEEGEQLLDDQEEAARKKLRSLTEMRMFHEKQVSLIERLPAGEVAGFLDNQRLTAAVSIQSWWRKRSKTTRTASQQTVPLKQETESGERRKRERLAATNHRELGGRRGQQSREEIRQTHDTVQKLLKEFYSRQNEKGGSADEEHTLHSLIHELEEDCRLLLETAPKLSELEREDEIDDRFLIAPAHSVATMAQKKHQKDLKAHSL